jgi:hypothetical protein
MPNNEKWNPKNAPDIQRDFEGKPPEKPTQIATKKELDHLIAERANPVRNLDYLPNSPATSKLQERMEQQREEKIKTLQQILGKYKDHARDDFNINADDYLLKFDKDKGAGY